MKTITLILCLFTLSITGQTRLSITQDARLLLVGDHKGNNTLTPNLTLRATQFLAKDPVLNAFTFIDYEIADLKGGLYSKIGFGLGINFDNWIKKFEFQTMLSSAFITRNGRSYPTWDLIGNISYDLTDKLALLIELQQTKRNDLENQPFIYSGKIGVRFNLFEKREKEIKEQKQNIELWEK